MKNLFKNFIFLITIFFLPEISFSQIMYPGTPELVGSEEDFWVHTKDKPPTVVKEQIGLVHVPRPDGKALIASLRAKSLIKLDFHNLKEVKEEIIFNNKIDRIRDIQVHPSNGKIYLLSEKNYGQDGPEEDGLWLMEKN